jgi:hypothetical protein
MKEHGGINQSEPIHQISIVTVIMRGAWKLSSQKNGFNRGHPSQGYCRRYHWGRGGSFDHVDSY